MDMSTMHKMLEMDAYYLEPRRKTNSVDNGYFPVC